MVGLDRVGIHEKRRKKGVEERESGQVPLIIKAKKIDTDVWVPLVIVKEGTASRDYCWS